MRRLKLTRSPYYHLMEGGRFQEVGRVSEEGVDPLVPISQFGLSSEPVGGLIEVADISSGRWLKKSLAGSRGYSYRR